MSHYLVIFAIVATNRCWFFVMQRTTKNDRIVSRWNLDNLNLHRKLISYWVGQKEYLFRHFDLVNVILELVKLEIKKIIVEARMETWIFVKLRRKESRGTDVPSINFMSFLIDLWLKINSMMYPYRNGYLLFKIRCSWIKLGRLRALNEWHSPWLCENAKFSRN